jgi:hypothetical protein
MYELAFRGLHNNTSYWMSRYSGKYSRSLYCIWELSDSYVDQQKDYRELNLPQFPQSLQANCRDIVSNWNTTISFNIYSISLFTKHHTT